MTFAKTVCIIDLVKYMAIEAKKCYANTDINPVNGLNDMFGKRWMGRLVGNTPEVMPLDTCLFQDVKESVRKHVAMSLTIREPGVKDDRLFLMTTPKDAWRAYSRVFDPQTGVAPTSKQILHDIHRVKNACLRRRKSG